jgi:hypothetical protein
LLAAVVRAGSPNTEFEDVELGLSLAQVLGVVPREASGEGDSQPFIALAAAARQHRNPRLRDEIQQCTIAAASQPDRVGTCLTEVACIAQEFDFVLPTLWRLCVIAHNRAKTRRQINRHAESK